MQAVVLVVTLLLKPSCIIFCTLLIYIVICFYAWFQSILVVVIFTRFWLDSDKTKKKKLFLRRRILILLDWYRSTFFFIFFFYLNQLYGLAFWNCSRIRYWTAWERQGLAGANIVVSGEPANNLRVLTFSALWLRLTFQLSRFQLDCFRWMGVVVVVRSIHRLISFKVYDLQQPNFMYLLTDDWYVHTLENLGWNVCTHSLLTRSETVVVAFSSLSRIFGKCLIFIPCLRVFLSFFFFKWRLAWAH